MSIAGRPDLYPHWWYARTEAPYEGRNVRAQPESVQSAPPIQALSGRVGERASVHGGSPEALAQRGPAAVYISPDGEYTLFDNTMVTQMADSAGNGSKRSHKQT
jgi:hypothetical protein